MNYAKQCDWYLPICELQQYSKRHEGYECPFSVPLCRNLFAKTETNDSTCYNSMAMRWYPFFQVREALWKMCSLSRDDLHLCISFAPWLNFHCQNVAWLLCSSTCFDPEDLNAYLQNSNSPYIRESNSMVVTMQIWNTFSSLDSASTRECRKVYMLFYNSSHSSKRFKNFPYQPLQVCFPR